jgi:hypothetical protein
VPLFYEDSLGAKLVDGIESVMDTPGSADDELIEDAGALETAQREANGQDPEAIYAEVGDDWIPVFGPSKLSGFWDVAGTNASKITMPLVAAGITFAWDPYPPEEMPGSATPFYHLMDRPFTLLVAPADAPGARGLLSALPGADSQFGLPATTSVPSLPGEEHSRLPWVIVLVALALSILMGFGYYIWR